MNPIGVFYATREGQTRRIAEYIGSRFQQQGFAVDAANVSDRAAVSLKSYSAVILAASVHAGRHEREMVRFVERHRAELDAIPNAFISVTLSQAGVQRANATAAEHAAFMADVQKMLDVFIKDTGWTPKRVLPVAGALLYKEYNFIVRFIMKWIARKAGGDTDTSRDYEYTNWTAIDGFVEEFGRSLRETPKARDAA